MRRFLLLRDEDLSGVSGTGLIAEGCLFSDGKCVLRWTTRYRSLCFYDSLAELEAIHGHGGKTHVQWLDEGAPEPRKVRQRARRKGKE